MNVDLLLPAEKLGPLKAGRAQGRARPLRDERRAVRRGRRMGREDERARVGVRRLLRGPSRWTSSEGTGSAMRACSPSRPARGGRPGGAPQARTRAGGSRPGYDPVPLEYFQGVTSDPHRNLFFDGLFVGLYRTDSELVEEARNNSAIPVDVFERERYNHIGDITWDRREGGRVLLPLECFIPFLGNPCKTGSIGVADPGHAAVALLREARPGLHRQGDVGGDLARRTSCCGRPTARQRRQRPARLRHEGDHGGERRARRPAAAAGARAPRRGPAERHHRRRLLQGPAAARRPARRAVPRVVRRPAATARAGSRSRSRSSASPRASTS